MGIYNSRLILFSNPNADFESEAYEWAIENSANIIAACRHSSVILFYVKNELPLMLEMDFKILV